MDQSHLLIRQFTVTLGQTVQYQIRGMSNLELYCLQNLYNRICVTTEHALQQTIRYIKTFITTEHLLTRTLVTTEQALQKE